MKMADGKDQKSIRQQENNMKRNNRKRKKWYNTLHYQKVSGAKEIARLK